MTTLTNSNHAICRLSQRGLSIADANFIVANGTEVEGGYIFLKKNCSLLERELKFQLQRIRKLCGKRVVEEDGHLITAYHATKSKTHRLLKNCEEREQEIWQ